MKKRYILLIRLTKNNTFVVLSSVKLEEGQIKSKTLYSKSIGHFGALKSKRKLSTYHFLLAKDLSHFVRKKLNKEPSQVQRLECHFMGSLSTSKAKNLLRYIRYFGFVCMTLKDDNLYGHNGLRAKKARRK